MRTRAWLETKKLTNLARRNRFGMLKEFQRTLLFMIEVAYQKGICVKCILLLAYVHFAHVWYPLCSTKLGEFL